MKKVVNLFDLLLTRLDLVCWFQIVLSVLCWIGKYSQENKRNLLPIWYGIPKDTEIRASFS